MPKEDEEQQRVHKGQKAKEAQDKSDEEDDTKEMERTTNGGMKSEGPKKQPPALSELGLNCKWIIKRFSIKDSN